ncbi:MAG: nucleotidyl transferase AbiEii/AbiGii toxin family protein, partial [Verrucomicrobiae bacterium]|nr:nucleotidyl transferase AbiEii/AbiGii toxin family protein [Verrucomicrobiae bacterium]
GKFLLKGAMLFAVWDAIPHRPSRDLDLLGFGSTELLDIETSFRDIVQTPVPPDGLVFDPESVLAEPIREVHAYGGVRVRLIGWLGKAEVPVQIDIGSGDAVTPDAEGIHFPVLLDHPAPWIRAYPIYTVVAEKVEAATVLKEVNSRMKDFYDLWFLAGRFEFDGTILRKAIEATFARRKTPLPHPPEPFAEKLVHDPAKQTQWAGFLRRNRLPGEMKTFPAIVEDISRFVGPVLRTEVSRKRWYPVRGWED